MHRESDYITKKIQMWECTFIMYLEATYCVYYIHFVQDLRQFVKSSTLSLPAKITSLTLFPTPSLQTRANLVSIDFSRIASDCAGGSISTEAAVV